MSVSSVFVKSIVFHFTFSPTMSSFFSKFECVNTLCAAVVEGARVVRKESGFGPMCLATEKAIERWRYDGSSR